MQKIIILIHCKDQKAIISTVTNYIASKEGNIIYLDQHVDADENVFFMRLECEFSTKNWNLNALKSDFEQKLAKAPLHLKSNELHDLWLFCELGKPVREVIALFSQRHLHLPEQKILLGLQELIETGYLEIAIADEEDRVFFNTERLYLD